MLFHDWRENRWCMHGVVLFMVCFMALPAVVANVSDPVPGADRVAARVAPRARPYPLSAVRVLDGPFRRAMEADLAYLLSFDPDRQLAPFRDAAGLHTDAARYGGWNRSGLNLGHYLVAVSHAWKATGDARFRDRIERLVTGLQACQEARGDGYLSGIKGMDAFWEQVAAGDFEATQLALNDRGAVFYVYHKMVDGLLHVYRAVGDDRALHMAARFADWIEHTFADMEDEAFQRFLVAEHGGMVEALADLYAATADERYLALAQRFRHRAVIDPLANRQDRLRGLHGNSTVVKLLGEARIYELLGEAEARTATAYFLNQVIDHHCYAHGGYTDDERFGLPDQLAGRMGHRSAETCKTYNLLKVLRHVYSWAPTPALFDYYEAALYNHILASIDPEEPGAFVYYMTVRPGDTKVYSRPFGNFWCCVSTGQENHVKYGESVYWYDDNGIWVNLFIPSELTDAQRGLRLRLETEYPNESRIRLRMTCREPSRFELRLRCPSWAGPGLEIRVNGDVVDAAAVPGSYAAVGRVWRDGDQVEMHVPQPLRTVSMPDLASRVALFRGPVLLAADLGPVEEPPWAPYHLYGGNPQDPGQWPIRAEIPTLVTGGGDPSAWLEASPDDPLQWRTRPGVGRPGRISFSPLFEMHGRRMSLYLDTVAAAPQKVLDVVRVGDPYSEFRQHHLRGERCRSGPGPCGRAWRDAREGWFAYELSLPAGTEDARLVVTYWGGDHASHGWERSFRILANGTEIGRETLAGEAPGAFVERVYPLGTAVGGPGVTIRFQAGPGTMAGGVYGVRLEGNRPGR